MSFGRVEHDVLVWLLTERVGLSSQAMAGSAVGIVTEAGGRHPYDPDDLSRCLRLLDCAPGIRERFDRIAALSPTWAALIAEWPLLESVARSEGVHLRATPGSEPGAGYGAFATDKMLREILGRSVRPTPNPSQENGR